MKGTSSALFQKCPKARKANGWSPGYNIHRGHKAAVSIDWACLEVQGSSACAGGMRFEVGIPASASLPTAPEQEESFA